MIVRALFAMLLCFACAGCTPSAPREAARVADADDAPTVGRGARCFRVSTIDNWRVIDERQLVVYGPGRGEACRRPPRWAVVDSADRMDRVWAAAAHPGGARRHVFGARLVDTLLDHGVTELATRSPRDCEGFGFARVFDPISGSL